VAPPCGIWDELKTEDCAHSGNRQEDAPVAFEKAISHMLIVACCGLEWQEKDPDRC